MSICIFSPIAFLGKSIELTETLWRMSSGTRARKADVEQCTLSAAISLSAPKSHSFLQTNSDLTGKSHPWCLSPPPANPTPWEPPVPAQH